MPSHPSIRLPTLFRAKCRIAFNRILRADALELAIGANFLSLLFRPPRRPSSKRNTRSLHWPLTGRRDGSKIRTNPQRYTAKPVAIRRFSVFGLATGLRALRSVMLITQSRENYSPVIIPGNPQKSRLIRVLETGFMPPDGGLGEEQIQLIRSWIAADCPADFPAAVYGATFFSKLGQSALRVGRFESDYRRNPLARIAAIRTIARGPGSHPRHRSQGIHTGGLVRCRYRWGNGPGRSGGRCLDLGCQARKLNGRCRMGPAGTRRSDPPGETQ